MADQQIVIDIEARTAQAMQKLRAMGKMMRAQSAAMATSMQGVQEQLQALGQGKGFDMPEIRGRAEAMEAFDKQTKKVNTNMNTLAAQGMVAAESMESAGSKGKKAGRGISNSFDEAALGVMFFGMQIQRIFGGIIRSGISTFNKVHSQLESTTTATDRLSGAWKFLKFNIGEAMQPLMAFLFPIVESIARWVEEHQKLTRWILLSGAAVGALLMAYGSLKLGIGAVIDMFSKLSGFLGGFSTLISPIAIAIAAVVAGLAGIATMMSQSDFFSKEFKKNVLDPLGGAFSDLGINWGLLVDIGDVLLGVLTVLAQFLTSALSAAINLIVDGIGAMIDSFQSLIHIVKAAQSAYEAWVASKLGMDAKAARAQAEAQHQATQALNDRADAIKNVKEANKAMDKAGRQMNLAFQSVRQGGFKFSEQMKFYKQLEKTAKATKGAKMSVAPNMSKVPRMSKVPTGGPGGMSKLPEKSMKDTAKETKKSNSFLSSIDQTLKQLKNDNISAETARSTVEDITSAANRQR